MSLRTSLILRKSTAARSSSPTLNYSLWLTNLFYIYRHISKQHGSLRPFACTECPKAYLHLKDLERHFTSTHEKEGKLNGRFECEECSKVFTHLYLLNCHKMCEHAEKQASQCDQCTKSYASK